ncbi:hypothetical protein LINPERPRIM_LOCUS29478 [Linum perenne]
MKKRSIHWCKGAKLCESIWTGGLGFQEFGSFNKALLARQGWRLLNQPDAIWARLLKSLYFPRELFCQLAKGVVPPESGQVLWKDVIFLPWDHKSDR